MADNTQTGSGKPKKKKVLPLIIALVVLAAVAFGINKIIYSMHHEVTDDAQVDADITPVIARVGGYVSEIRFSDNQHVKKGDTLVKLDDRDLRIRVEQAQAALDNAMATVGVSKANVSTASANAATAGANIEAAKVRLWKAQQDFTRYQQLSTEKAITNQQFEGAQAELKSAQSQLDALMKQQSAAQTQVGSASQQISVAQSQIAARQAELDFAKLQLSYATIIAPVSGIASKKNIQAGQLVNAGSPLFAIVSDTEMYVTANFKETQLTKMHEGQHVQIVADAFKKEKIDGEVSTFSAATGAKFSLLPPDNATGNFVKVVQRVPVKIKMNTSRELLAKLRPGMSVKVAVDLD